MTRIFQQMAVESTVDRTSSFACRSCSHGLEMLLACKELRKGSQTYDQRAERPEEPSLRCRIPGSGYLRLGVVLEPKATLMERH